MVVLLQAQWWLWASDVSRCVGNSIGATALFEPHSRPVVRVVIVGAYCIGLVARNVKEAERWVSSAQASHRFNELHGLGCRS